MPQWILRKFDWWTEDRLGSPRYMMDTQFPVALEFLTWSLHLDTCCLLAHMFNIFFGTELFSLLFVFHMFFISKLCYSPLAVNVSHHIFGMLLVFTLMASICDISTKLICFNNPINRKSLHRLRYCWISLLIYAFQSFM